MVVAWCASRMHSVFTFGPCLSLHPHMLMCFMHVYSMSKSIHIFFFLIWKNSHAICLTLCITIIVSLFIFLHLHYYSVIYRGKIYIFSIVIYKLYRVMQHSGHVIVWHRTRAKKYCYRGILLRIWLVQKRHETGVFIHSFFCSN